MYKLLLVVLAVLAVASAQYVASPYYGGSYGGLYRSGYGYNGYASPYAYSSLGYTGYTGYGGLYY